MTDVGARGQRGRLSTEETERVDLPPDHTGWPGGHHDLTSPGGPRARPSGPCRAFFHRSCPDAARFRGLSSEGSPEKYGGVCIRGGWGSRSYRVDTHRRLHSSTPIDPSVERSRRRGVFEPRLTGRGGANGPNPRNESPMALQSALAAVREAPFILDAVRAGDDLVVAAGNDGGPHAAAVLAAAVHDDDQVTAIAAVHALGAVFDERAAQELSALLSDPRTFLREHAAWALGTRVPRLDAVGRLVAGVAAGGFATVINQRTLRRWAQSAPDHVALALEGALLSPGALSPGALASGALAREAPDARARLVETMGLVPGPVASRAILRVAAAPYEADRVRHQTHRLDQPG